MTQSTPDTKPTPLLALVNIQKTYKGDVLKKRHTVLKNLSLSFPEGRCTGLLGHNGAGKTTTIRTILGLIVPDSGSVLYKGRPMEVGDRSALGYMPEVNKLPANLTPEEVLTFHLRLQKTRQSRAEIKKRIAEKLAEVGLSDAATRRIGRLSKGMARRVAWAQATIHDPSLVILDEPFSGLDPVGRQHLRRWIAALKRRGTSIILSTHELWTIETLCDDVHVLSHGEVVFSTTNNLGADGAADRPHLAVTALHLSGTTVEALETLRANANLPPWQSHRQDGFLHALGFATYGEATQWLEAALRQGLVIVRFGADPVVSEEQVLKYFPGSEG